MILSFFIFLLLVSKPAVNYINVEKKGTEITVYIISSEPVNTYKTFTLKNPERIIIDLPGTLYKLKEAKKEVDIEPLLRIRTGEKEWDGKLGTRVVFDLTSAVPYRISQLGDTLSISIKLQDPQSDEIYFYRSRGKRDPFEPLIAEENEEDSLLSIGNAELVGIISEGENKVALVKDAKGKGFILKKGDRIKGGSVLDITKSSVVFLLTDYGFKRKVILKIKEDSRRAR